MSMVQYCFTPICVSVGVIACAHVCVGACTDTFEDVCVCVSGVCVSGVCVSGVCVSGVCVSSILIYTHTVYVAVRPGDSVSTSVFVFQCVSVSYCMTKYV